MQEPSFLREFRKLHEQQSIQGKRLSCALRHKYKRLEGQLLAHNRQQEVQYQHTVWVSEIAYILQYIIISFINTILSNAAYQL